MTPDAALATAAQGAQPPPSPTEAPAPQRQGWRGVLRSLRGQGLVLMLALIVVYFWLSSDAFLTSNNLLLIGATASALGIMALAQTFLIVSGGVDLSVGSAVSLTGVTIGLLFGDGLDIWAASAVGLAVGGGIGVVNGFLAVVMRINPLIVSLGTLSFFSGLASQLTNGRTLIVADASFDFVGSGKVGPIPFPLIVFLGLAAVAYAVQRWTVIGRSVYAIGGNPIASKLSGLRVERMQFSLYVLSGLSAGLAGVMITSQLNGASTEVGTTFLLSVVTAVILGGTSLAGGIGGVIGTVVAVFILQVLQNGFALVGYSSAVQTMALGVVLIVAVLLDQITRGARR
jgi:ribose transport system permease protein